MEEINWILEAQRAGTNEASLAASNISIAQSLEKLVVVAETWIKPVVTHSTATPQDEAYILGVPLDKILKHPQFSTILRDIDIQSDTKLGERRA